MGTCRSTRTAPGKRWQPRPRPRPRPTTSMHRAAADEQPSTQPAHSTQSVILHITPDNAPQYCVHHPTKPILSPHAPSEMLGCDRCSGSSPTPGCPLVPLLGPRLELPVPRGCRCGDTLACSRGSSVLLGLLGPLPRSRPPGLPLPMRTRVSAGSSEGVGSMKVGYVRSRMRSSSAASARTSSACASAISFSFLCVTSDRMRRAAASSVEPMDARSRCCSSSTLLRPTRCPSTSPFSCARSAMRLASARRCRWRSATALACSRSRWRCSASRDAISACAALDPADAALSALAPSLNTACMSRVTCSSCSSRTRSVRSATSMSQRRCSHSSA
mmetsp:Transcript_21039/g.53486  ORF Transcript_21039/g.53486 Transcript_21039/m.53486 type:complete len:331 (+) Transcript_21039:216-1208(+)